MAITLRGNKASALTYGELDANYTTLGLTHGMTTSNVAISVNTATATTATITTGDITTVNATDIDVTDKILINQTEGGTDAKLQVQGEQFNSTIVSRKPNTFVGDAAFAMVVETDFTESNTNLAANQGTGIFMRVQGEDDGVYVGGLGFGIDSFTSTSDYDSYLKIKCYDNGSLTEVAKITPDKMEMPTTFNLPPTNYADLPSSPANGDFAMLNNDGADAYQGKMIFYMNQWQYVDNNGPVATA